MAETNKDPKGQEDIKSDDSPKPIQVSGMKDGIDGAMKQQAIVSELVGWYGKWDTWRKSYETLWDEIYRLYMSVMNSTKTPTRAKIFVPITFQVIENAVAKFTSLIFNQEEFFEVDPVDPKDEAQAAVINELLLYQLGRANFFTKFIDFVKQLLLYGTSYMKIYWKVKRQWVWTRTPKRQDISIFGFKLGSRIVGWDEKKEYKVVERRPEIDVLDIMDVYPDPEAKDVMEGKGVFVRSWIHYDEVVQMGKGKFPVYANTEDPRLKDPTEEIGRVLRNRYQARGVNQPPQEDNKRVEILEFWGAYDLDNDGISEECLLTIGNRSVLLKAVPNPFHHQKRPIVKSTLFPVPMEWYGVGMVEPIIPLQHELNTLRRQRLDNINLSLNRMWKVNSLADVDVDTLVSSPNGIVLTDDMTAVEPLVTSDSTGGAYQEAQIVQSDIENVTVPRSVQGIPESGRLGRTARGAQLIIGQALEKFGLASKLLEETCIKKVLRLFHQLNLQFLDSEDVAREIGVVGNLFDQTITPEMIRADVQFRMVGISDMVGKEGKINQIISFIGVFKDILAPETLQTMSQKVWRLMGFDPDEVQITALPQVSKQLVVGKDDQNLEASLTGQAQANGASAPTAVPGARSI